MMTFIMHKNQFHLAPVGVAGGARENELLLGDNILSLMMSKNDTRCIIAR